jgi:hypothetical protein
MADENPTPESQDKPDDKPTAGDDKRFTQAELDAVVKDRLERQKRASEAAQEKTRKEAEEKALKEQGEFKTLAESRQAEIEALKPKAEYAEQLEAVVTKLLAEQRKDVPKHIVALLDKLSITDQLDYITTNKGEWEKSVEDKEKRPLNINAANRGGGGQSKEAVIEAEKQRMRSAGRRGII